MNFALPVVIILTFFLSACGQRGPLYLPENPKSATTTEEDTVKKPSPTEPSTNQETKYLEQEIVNE